MNRPLRESRYTCRARCEIANEFAAIVGTPASARRAVLRELADHGADRFVIGRTPIAHGAVVRRREDRTVVGERGAEHVAAVSVEPGVAFVVVDPPQAGAPAVVPGDEPAPVGAEPRDLDAGEVAAIAPDDLAGRQVDQRDRALRRRD